MKLVQTFFVLHLLAAVAALALAFALGGSLELAFGVIFIGGFWFYANLRNVHGLEFLILFAAVLAAVSIIFWFSAPTWLALIGVVAAVGAWDLDNFLQRLKAATREGISSRLGVDHLRRLGIAEGLGFLLGMVGLTTRTQVDFWVAVGLVFVVAIGLNRLIAYLRKQNQ